MNRFEAEVFGVGSRFLNKQAAAIGERLSWQLSCEPYLNHLFAKAFDRHRFICAREIPYCDLGWEQKSESGKDRKDGLDMMVIAPDKKKSVLIETKLVHDRTSNGYRWREREDGSSIAGDIERLRRIPAKRGRSKFLMVLMAAVTSTESSADWAGWLRTVRQLEAVKDRLDSGDGPLFRLPKRGWFDILVHRVE